MLTLELSLLAVALLLGLYLLDRLALWAERRGWIFYRKVKPTGNALGATALELQKLFESGMATHVIETRQDQGKEKHDPGSQHT